MPLSLAQQHIADDSRRFRVVVAGRRFGKTHLSIRELCYHARTPEQEVWYVAPTYRQAKQIVWRKLKHKLQDLRWAKRINESELIQFWNSLYNDEERFIEWLDYFTHVITFCKLHNIQLKCFFMHNPFSSTYHY
jgi:hypothetical protein